MGTEGAPENVKHGDTIDIEITGIGTLSNPVVREGQQWAGRPRDGRWLRRHPRAEVQTSISTGFPAAIV
jgi:hypothetical protein